MATRTQADIRDDLVHALEADVIGPFDRQTGVETLPIPPSRFYLTGFLAPSGDRTRTTDPTDDESLEAGDDSDDGEATSAPDPAPKPNTHSSHFPASMGLSVLLPPGTTSGLTAMVHWADYHPIEKDPAQAELEPEVLGQAKPKKRTPRDRIEWQRVPHDPVSVVVPLDRAQLLDGIDVPGSNGLQLVGKLEVGDAPGLASQTLALSLFLVNRRPPADKRFADESYVFQTTLELLFEPGFCGRPNRQHEQASDLDDRVADLQYRDHFEYAVGHGVSVAVTGDAPVRRVRTTWLPRHEVRRVVTHESDAIETRMEQLATLSDAASIDLALAALPQQYGAWIALQAQIPLDSPRREEARAQLLAEATVAQQRIAAGIALLRSEPVVLEAFRIANRAMATAQRQRSGKHEPTFQPSWRLFQLAFVLMNLPSVFDPHHVDRETAELIFFPTGGGKTEAYLGVIAVALVLRRLRRRQLPDQGLGVAVILRYTLRLLTLDQLGRAATLMCALELTRRERPAELGTQRFAVGIWVGRKATANTLSEVAKKIIDYKGSTSSHAYSPFPLTECPWCQAKLEKGSFDIRPKPSKPEEVVVACVSSACAFAIRNSRDGIPVLFVDEQIYQELPAFLVATVDKFALMAWRGEIGRLFGKVTARDTAREVQSFFGPTDDKAKKGSVHVPLPGGLQPPELIVQDELHLISGPLGTMVGLYETAVERLSLATVDGRPVKPKVLASTATVKRAREQIRALFGRAHAAIFPPPGVDAQETFFSKVDHVSHGRLYVGVAAPGRASKAVMHDVYNTTLAAGQKAYQEAGGKAAGAASPADPYMTLVGYFNALRELGGMRRLVEDQVLSRVRQIEARRPSDWQGPHPWARDRTIGEPVELTSRAGAGEIARAKERMATAHALDAHIDVVLASNMISVGVDIERLGLMVVAGQPKSTNEYIQATSRIGRKYPGLVVTVFNLVKPRDRSHYERFVNYHQAFYRFVEATSVTPFSGPALQRGLAGVIVSMARLGTAGLTRSEAVMKLRDHRKVAEAHVDALADRAASHRRDVGAAEETAIRTTLAARGRNILDAWDQIVSLANQEGADRCYSPWDPGRKGKPMLFGATDDTETRSDEELKFAAPSSMRDVEGSVHLWVKRGPLGGRRPG